MKHIYHDRYQKYRIMWLLAAFDLPTETKVDRKSATEFRKFLLKDGFKMHQYSIYARQCSSRENMKVHINRIKKNLPRSGKVSIFNFTDAQFARTVMFLGRNTKKIEKPANQLTLF